MSKYGFDENELVKTVVDMIDKDGFHKEVVTYGKVAPAVPKMKAGLISKEDDDLSGSLKITFITVNIPEGGTVYFDYHSTDDGYAYDIGDTLDTDHSATEDSRIAGVDAAIAHGFSSDENNTEMYFYVYAIDEDDKVIERTTLIVPLED